MISCSSITPLPSVLKDCPGWSAKRIISLASKKVLHWANLVGCCYKDHLRLYSQRLLWSVAFSRLHSNQPVSADCALICSCVFFSSACVWMEDYKVFCRRLACRVWKQIERRWVSLEECETRAKVPVKMGWTVTHLESMFVVTVLFTPSGITENKGFLSHLCS